MGKHLNHLKSYQYLQIYFHWYLKQWYFPVNYLFPRLSMGRRAQRARWGPGGWQDTVVLGVHP